MLVSGYKKLCLSLALSAVSVCAMATADGPDHYAVQSDKPVPIHAAPSASSSISATLPIYAKGIQNKRCKNVISFSDWDAMNAKERAEARKKAWCEIQYRDVSGWVPMAMLAEDNTPARPTFVCREDGHQAEVEICRDRTLIALDHKMQRVYQDALKASNQDKTLKAMQHGWVKGRNDCWKQKDAIVACIERSYLERMSYLQARWALMPKIESKRYVCQPSDVITVDFYGTGYAALSTTLDGKKQVFLNLDPTQPKRFDGEFGAYVVLMPQGIRIHDNTDRVCLLQ